MAQKKEVELGLHERMQQKIAHAKNRSHITDKEVYALSKEFFNQLLKLDYEFTHEELIDELQKTYLEKQDLEQTTAFIKKVGIMEFTSNEYTQEELRTMLTELQNILNRLARQEQKLTWSARLKQTLFGKKEEPKSNLDKQSGKEIVLKELLETIKKIPEGKQKQELYQQAIITYELLSEESKVLFYNDLLGIYYQLQETNQKQQETEEPAKIESIQEETQNTNLTEETTPASESVVDAVNSKTETDKTAPPVTKEAQEVIVETAANTLSEPATEPITTIAEEQAEQTTTNKPAEEPTPLATEPEEFPDVDESLDLDANEESADQDKKEPTT